MKVAYILTTFPSDTELFVRREIDFLAALGWRVAVLAARGAPGALGAGTGIEVVYRPSLASVQALTAIARFLRGYPLSLVRFPLLVLAVLRYCPAEALRLLANVHTIAHFALFLDGEDLQHVHACFLSWPACIALALSRLTGRRLSIAAHARDIFVEPGAVAEKVEAASFVAVCTDQGLRRLRELVPPRHHSKIHLHRHGVNTRDVMAEGLGVSGPCDRAAEPPTVAAIGRLVPKKGYGHLMLAAASLKKQGVRCRVRLVGDGPERPRLEQVRRELGLEDTAEIEGALAHADAMRLLKTADVLAVPSLIAPDGDRDGIPNVILEAFALGVPVIATRLDGIMEAVEHLQTGLLVDPGDAESLAGGIRRLIEDRPLRESLAANARLLVEADFSLAANVPEMARLFERAQEQPC